MTRILAVLALCLALLPFDLRAAEKPTRDQAREITLRAADVLARQGVDAARRAFHQPGEFRFGEIYVNVVDQNGTWLIYPPNVKNEGKSVFNARDADGKLLVQEIIRTAKQHGEGWVAYRWLNPETNVIEAKTSFVKFVPELNLVAYVGVYQH